jgi:electron transfer flavoprotein alpha subunit
MGSDVLVLAEHAEGELAESTFELIGKARELASAWGGQTHVAVLGAPRAAGALGGADVVHVVDHPAVSVYSPEAYERCMLSVLEHVQPKLLLLGTTTPGMDLGAALSVLWDAPLAAYAVGLVAEGDAAVATCQIYGGKLMAEVVLESERSIATVIGGSFPPSPGRSGGAGSTCTDEPPDLGDLRTVVRGVKVPEATGVDITAADILVSVGRGIQSRDNLTLVEELAGALGVPLSASRPIIDQGWLPKAHQVGKSGQKVKPRAYLAFGISGAPEHLEGMRDAELIVACNTDAGAPIFDVAHYGTTIDLFDLLPELSARLGG